MRVLAALLFVLLNPFTISCADAPVEPKPIEEECPRSETATDAGDRWEVRLERQETRTETFVDDDGFVRQRERIVCVTQVCRVPKTDAETADQAIAICERR